MAPARLTISRALSHALRHEPWLYELEMDAEGWVELTELLSALREQGAEWRELELRDIEQTIADAEKRRHEIVEGRIRALYGHSLPGRLDRTPGHPLGLSFTERRHSPQSQYGKPASYP